MYRIFKFDLLFVPWVYPDGVGTSFIAAGLGVPIVIQALGSDINVHAKYPLRKRIIVRALGNVDKVIAVSDALKAKIVSLKVPEEKIISIRNGVDRALFRPMDMNTCRNTLSLPSDGRVVLFIGNLVPIKGISYLIEAFATGTFLRQKTRLIILGDGPLNGYLKRKAADLGLNDIVMFMGSRSHNEIPLWMNACDIFCLPSLNEGCPNVVLEALACGKPVVATRVGGIPEIIQSSDCGILVRQGNATELTLALEKALSKKWDRDLLQKSAQIMSWQENAVRVFNEFQLVVNE
jgi:glycosyltransferase involved in cell wall biosynthesis